MRHSCWIFALLLLAMTAATSADTTDAPQGACYLGYGKSLEAEQSRQLTLQANISQFLYQPGGLEIAYAGSQRSGDTLTNYVRLIGVKHGSTAILISNTGDGKSDSAESQQVAPYTLCGWSADGRYLLLQQEWYVPGSGGLSGYEKQHYACVDVGADPIHVTPVSLPVISETNFTILWQEWHFWWSPDRTQILFTDQARVKEGAVSWFADLFCAVYAPKTGKFQTIAENDKQSAEGWLDNSHALLEDSPLLAKGEPSAPPHYVSADIASGSQTAIPKPAKMPPLFDDITSRRAAYGHSPTASYLTLADQPKRIEYAPKAGAADCHMLWVRRTQGPKPLSAACVGISPGATNPKAVWSPTGDQIAYISRGDLFVTNLTVREAAVREKYDAGEPMTCKEEQEIALGNLKQIGLAALQYSQDNNEKYPSGDDWQNEVKPYLQDDSVLSTGGHSVVYQQPPGLALASVDNPASTVLATVDLPCATVTLFADGHVKAFPKPDKGAANR